MWGLDATGDSNVVKEHIRKIRQKLQKATGKDYIETVWGVTKIFAVFVIGLLLTALAVCSVHSLLPSLAGAGFLGISWLLYAFVPPNSGLSLLKYLSCFGLLRTEELYGDYLNLDIFGFPVSRACCSLVVLAILLIAGIAAVLLLFRFKCNSAIVTPAFKFCPPFHPHSRLLCHEGYKILIAGRALPVILLFIILMGCCDLGRNYTPSAGEEYYRDMMLSLEGELTEEKEDVIEGEQNRYDEALSEIERIDKMVAGGDIDEKTGDDMKEPLYAQLAFYPWFQRIQSQYHRILSNGGVFVYDTGYLYLFGRMDDSFLTDLLLISLCLAFSFSGAMSMEDGKGLWPLLSSTKAGKRQIVKNKWLVCGITCAVVTVLPLIFHIPAISHVYPIGQITAGIQSTP